MTKLKIAVIGKSAAGKSAFIRTFSSTPDYINSVGRGQTTRAYAEYLFIRDYKEDFPQVEADLVTQTMFCESRITQVLSKIKDLRNSEEDKDIDWLKKQFTKSVYKQRIKEINSLAQVHTASNQQSQTLMPAWAVPCCLLP